MNEEEQNSAKIIITVEVWVIAENMHIAYKKAFQNV